MDIQELSKRTLGRYFEKARDNVRYTTILKKEHQRRAKTNQRAADIPYLSQKDRVVKQKLANAHKDSVNQLDNKLLKRKKGISTAMIKMKESTEISDLLTSVINSQPSEFKTVFNNLLVEKLSDKVEDLKQNMAGALYNNVVEESVIMRIDPHSGSDRSNILDDAEKAGHKIESERDDKGHIVLLHSSGLSKASFKSHLKNKGYQHDIIESEQIDELSKNTLKDYIVKSTTDKVDKTDKFNALQKRNFRINPHNLVKGSDDDYRSTPETDTDFERRKSNVINLKKKISGDISKTEKDISKRTRGSSLAARKLLGKAKVSVREDSNLDKFLGFNHE